MPNWTIWFFQVFKHLSVYVFFFFCYNPFWHLDSASPGRASLHGKSSLRIENIRSDDQGWYECKVLMLEQQYDTFHNGSWVHLTVNGEYAAACMTHDTRCHLESGSSPRSLNVRFLHAGVLSRFSFHFRTQFSYSTLKGEPGNHPEWKKTKRVQTLVGLSPQVRILLSSLGSSSIFDETRRQTRRWLLW